MKKLTFATATVLLCLIFSCKNNNSANNASQYKEANSKIYKAIETGDVSDLDSILADDAIDHGAPSGEEVTGRDSIKASLAQVHNMFSNLKLEVLNSATDNDVIMERVRMTGTSNVDMPGMPPKGTKIDMTTVEVTKWKDGKAYEHWTFTDQRTPMLLETPALTGKKAGKMLRTDTTSANK